MLNRPRSILYITQSSSVEQFIGNREKGPNNKKLETSSTQLKLITVSSDQCSGGVTSFSQSDNSVAPTAPPALGTVSEAEAEHIYSDIDELGPYGKKENPVDSAVDADNLYVEDNITGVGEQGGVNENLNHAYAQDYI